MANFNFDIVANNLMFDKDGEFYVKEVEDYLFSLIKTVDKQMLLVTLVNYSFDPKEENFKEFQKNLSIKLSSTVNPNDTIIVKVTGKNDDEATESIALNMKALINYFKDHNINHSHSCWFCGESSDETVCIKGFNVYSHKSCKENYKKDAIKEIDNDNNYNENPTLSIILSFLGAFIGLIPFVLIFLFSEYYYSILLAIPPFCSYFGYKLGKAKPDKKATVCSIVFSFIAVATAYLLLVVLLKELYGEYSYMEIVEATIGDLLFMLVSYGLGIMISYRYISKNTDKIKKEIDKL